MPIAFITSDNRRWNSAMPAASLYAGTTTEISSGSSAWDETVSWLAVAIRPGLAWVMIMAIAGIPCASHKVKDRLTAGPAPVAGAFPPGAARRKGFWLRAKPGIVVPCSKVRSNASPGRLQSRRLGMRPTRLGRRKAFGLGMASLLPPHAGASQSDRSEGYFDGDGVRLFVVRG